ncbi:MAG: hypothetical protein ACYDBQ_09460, partial [Thermoplasmatota archaeon]
MRKTRARPHDDAVGGMISFLVAGVLFIATVGALVFTTQSQTRQDQSRPQAADQQLAANRLADLLVGSPGVGWSAGADNIQRLGLGASN